MEEEIRTVMAGKPEHIERGLIEAKGKYVDKEELRRQLESLKESWPSLSSRIRKQILPFEQVRENLRRVGAPYEPEMIGISRERFRKTVIYMFTLEDTPVTFLRQKCSRYLEISGYLLRFHGESVTGGLQAEADGQDILRQIDRLYLYSIQRTMVIYECVVILIHEATSSKQDLSKIYLNLL